MHRNTSGFTLVETLISLFVLSIAVLGFLQLDLQSQALFQETLQQQLQQQQFNQFYEIVQIHDAEKNDCPACNSLVRNQETLVVWQQQLPTLMATVTGKYTVHAPQHLQVAFCEKDKLCDYFIVQV